MQHYEYPNATSPVVTGLVYQSGFYTVVRASVSVKNGEDEEKNVSAEGIARRSWRDVHSPQKGIDIAKGRALKALSKKLTGCKIRDILMNG